MKTSDIKKLFSRTISPEEFKELIATEVETYDKPPEKIGGSIPIIFEEDDELLIGTDEMMFLCKAYLDGSLDPAEISYMADAFTLSEDVDFSSELVRDEVESLCWFQTDRSWSVEEVRAKMVRLNE